MVGVGVTHIAWVDEGEVRRGLTKGRAVRFVRTRSDRTTPAVLTGWTL